MAHLRHTYPLKLGVGPICGTHPPKNRILWFVHEPNKWCVVGVLRFIRRHSGAQQTAGAMSSAASVVEAILCTRKHMDNAVRAQPINHGFCMACCTPWSESHALGDMQMCTQCLSMVHKDCMLSSCTVYGRGDGILLGQCRRCVASRPIVTADQAATSCSVCLAVHTAEGRVYPCTMCADMPSFKRCGGKSCDTCSEMIADGKMASWEAQDRVSFACAVRNNLHGPESHVLRPSSVLVRERNRSSCR